ncbi:MAG: hypothetical protein PGMFKBFP_02611 [Anaerolineales bacterium]|nr:hypothetical protein [Anaerolineales bacterium]
MSLALSPAANDETTSFGALSACGAIFNLSSTDIDFKSSIVNCGIGVTVAVAVGGTGVRVAAGVGGSPTGKGTGVRVGAQAANRMTKHRDRMIFITTSLLRILSHNYALRASRNSRIRAVFVDGFAPRPASACRDRTQHKHSPHNTSQPDSRNHSGIQL